MQGNGIRRQTQDCRAQKGFSLNLATSTRGADHERGLPTIESYSDVASDEMKEMIRNKFGSDDVLIPSSYNKAPVILHYQDIGAAAAAMGVCNFYTELSNQIMGLDKLSEMLSLVTGLETSRDDLQKIGRRIYTLERQFLVREGITKKDDFMQGKRVRTPISNGLFKGEYLDDEKFTTMLEQYYALRGWDLRHRRLPSPKPSMNSASTTTAWYSSKNNSGAKAPTSYNQQTASPDWGCRLLIIVVYS